MEALTALLAETRRCYACRTRRPIIQFHRDSSKSSGVCSRCIPCEGLRRQNPKIAQQSWLRRSYGLTTEQVALMAAEQDGRCAICGTTDGNLVVDHDHQTGTIRGLLCRYCNLTLGHARDNTTTLRAAADYLDAGGWNRMPSVKTSSI